MPPPAPWEQVKTNRPRDFAMFIGGGLSSGSRPAVKWRRAGRGPRHQPGRASGAAFPPSRAEGSAHRLPWKDPMLNRRRLPRRGPRDQRASGLPRRVRLVRQTVTKRTSGSCLPYSPRRPAKDTDRSRRLALDAPTRATRSLSGPAPSLPNNAAPQDIPAEGRRQAPQPSSAADDLSRMERGRGLRWVARVGACVQTKLDVLSGDVSPTGVIARSPVSRMADIGEI